MEPRTKSVVPQQPSLGNAPLWWQHVLGFEYGDVTTTESGGLTDAQMDEARAMLSGLNSRGLANMQAGLLAYMGMVMCDLADLTRQAVCRT